MDRKKLYLDLVREWSGRMNLVAKSTLDDLDGRHWGDSVQLAGYIESLRDSHDNFIVVDLGSGAGFPGVVLAILSRPCVGEPVPGSCHAPHRREMDKNHISPRQTPLEFGSPSAKYDEVPGRACGLPGMTIGKIICIESIGKKAAFLSEVKAKLGLDNLEVWNDRIENRIGDIVALRMDGVSGSACGMRSPGRGRQAAPEDDGVIFTARAFASLEKIFDLTHMVRGARYVLLKGRTAADEVAAAKKSYSFDYKMTPSKSGDGFVVEAYNVKKSKDKK
ncbi:MAG: class I SAM-dependent methyltransferase [Rickettsiales bacterium]|jgi:16S rRNA G527 N7-methylase RsmG|nr:class I SAM-dependent methyltransferase [Rickettsiales bacterium]